MRCTRRSRPGQKIHKQLLAVRPSSHLLNSSKIWEEERGMQPTTTSLGIYWSCHRMKCRGNIPYKPNFLMMRLCRSLTGGRGLEEKYPTTADELAVGHGGLLKGPTVSESVCRGSFHVIRMRASSQRLIHAILEAHVKCMKNGHIESLK